MDEGEDVMQTESRFEAWLDEEKRIVSFHEVPGSRYYGAEPETFWQVISGLILSGYRVQ